MAHVRPAPHFSPVKVDRSGSRNAQGTGVCGQGMSNVFAAPPIKDFKIFYRLSIPNRNPNPNPKNKRKQNDT